MKFYFIPFLAISTSIFQWIKRAKKKKKREKNIRNILKKWSMITKRKYYFKFSKWLSRTWRNTFNFVHYFIQTAIRISEPRRYLHNLWHIHTHIHNYDYVDCRPHGEPITSSPTIHNCVVHRCNTHLWMKRSEDEKWSINKIWWKENNKPVRKLYLPFAHVISGWPASTLVQSLKSITLFERWK